MVKTFKQYLKETPVSTSYTMKNKDMMRKKMSLEVFNTETPDVDFGTSTSVADVIKDTQNFIKQHPEEAQQLFLYGIGSYGLGKGEALLYYVNDKVELAGGSATGDIKIGSKVYEVKATTMTPFKISNFFLVGDNLTVGEKVIAKILKYIDAKNMTDELAALTQKGVFKSSEMNRGIFGFLRASDNRTFNKISVDINKEGEIKDPHQDETYGTSFKLDTKKVKEFFGASNIKFADIEAEYAKNLKIDEDGYIFFNKNNISDIEFIDLNTARDNIKIDSVTMGRVKMFIQRN